MIEQIMIIALLVTTIILLLRKWKILDLYEAYYGHVKWLPASDCYICLGFWLSWILLGISLIISWHFHLIQLLIPFCTIPIIAFLTHVIIVNEVNRNK